LFFKPKSYELEAKSCLRYYVTYGPVRDETETVTQWQQRFLATLNIWECHFVLRKVLPISNGMVKLPTTFVIIGATGDLAQKKLFPALFELYLENLLPKEWHIVAFSRRPWSDHDFRQFIRPLLDHTEEKKSLNSFLYHVFYHEGTFDDKESFERLFTRIQDTTKGRDKSRIVSFLSISPEFYSSVIAKKGAVHKALREQSHRSRLLVEKPFGHDLESARLLHILTEEFYEPNEIHLVDHYLGKPAFLRILDWRMCHSDAEMLFSKYYVESINVKLHEEIDITDRAAFYDKTGALRDVGQNHLLQMLAVALMNIPEDMTAKKMSAERKKVIDDLVTPKGNTLRDVVVQGQYEGYKEQVKNLASTTETFFRIKTEVNSERWGGVPVTLEGGKAMSKQYVAVEINFKEETAYGDSLIFEIQPDAGVYSKFKKDAARKKIAEAELKNSSLLHELPLQNAYGNIFLSSMRENAFLFPSVEEVMSAWRFVTPVIAMARHIPLQVYKKGTLGPNSD